MKRFLLLMFCLASYFAVSAQTTITGVVLDEDNIPLIGANVKIVGSSQKEYVTKADSDGEFKIVLDKYDTIKVVTANYVNFKPYREEVYSNKTHLQINMQYVKSVASSSNKYALKTNVFYDFTGTINFGVELPVDPQWTVDLSVNINDWNVYNKSEMRHILIQPEARYWLADSFKGHFFGVHTHYARYNMANVRTNVKFLGTNFASLNQHRFNGWLLGLGVGYGYVFNLYENLNLELEIGLGYAYMEYDKSVYSTNEVVARNANHNYWGITKLNVGFSYLF